MNDKPRPVSKAGQAAVGWRTRSDALAETIVRVEQQAIDEWLASDDAVASLARALEGANLPSHAARDILRRMGEERR